MTSLFTADVAILNEYVAWIFEHSGSRFKIQAAMFALVFPVLFSVPFEAHSVIQVYNIYANCGQMPSPAGGLGWLSTRRSIQR